MQSLDAYAESCTQVAFIEELQRRLTPVNGKPLKLPSSRSSPNLAHENGEGGPLNAPLDDMREEHKSPFELRALEVALDVVRTLALIWPYIVHAAVTYRGCPVHSQHVRQRFGLGCILAPAHNLLCDWLSIRVLTCIASPKC